MTENQSACRILSLFAFETIKSQNEEKKKA